MARLPRLTPTTSFATIRIIKRRFIKDKSAWTEPKNPYYALYQNQEVCDFILKEFGLEGPYGMPTPPEKLAEIMEACLPEPLKLYLRRFIFSQKYKAGRQKRQIIN